MPRPALRSRSLRRVKVRTPGGRLVVHYYRRKPNQARCALCGRPLAGVPVGRPVEIRNIPLSKKRPNRMFGGVLCPSCLERLLKKVIRREIVSVST